MNKVNTASLDRALLLVLHANDTSFGNPASALRLLVRDFGGGFPTEEETAARLEYLKDKHLVMELPKAIHIAHRIWKITDFGRQYIDDNNL